MKQIEHLLQLDTEVFLFINKTLQNPLFDAILPFLREKFFWIPVYGFILLHCTKYYGKKFFVPVIGVLLTFATSDFISSKIIKPYFHRLRPCNTEALEAQMHELVQCGSGFSFTSSHATNHFALSMFLIVSGLFISSRSYILLLLWAFSIAFSQVYVGVHYPADVLSGALLGVIIGTIFGLIFKKILCE